ncbi:unnamed protein product [Miscanthus lutarioriparius]|uniref:Peptidase A1 domain-containing protein n=1 Tax=Miscanthus lutarioriparius TaxID=422564 RepID=A0A811RIV4_9POAL|nr:unnamed protein product [Miscanthus lutarioriparius]
MASSSLAGLLLLLAMFSDAVVVGLAMPVEYEYHNYVVTPLSPHSYTAPAADVYGSADAQDDVAMSSSALHVRLHHRDSFAVNATAAELLKRRLQRDERRAAWIISKAAAAAGGNATRVVRRLSGGGRFVAPVVSGAPTSGEYIAKIVVGTPGVEALLVPDTGSDLTWLQCKPCQLCYPQSGPVFDPRRSTSRQDIRYNAPACQALGRSGGGGNAQRRTCVYTVGYGDGSTTSGDLISETLTFRAFAGALRLPHLSIGCGHNNQGLFGAPAAGILGLGRGLMSFPNQIAGLGYNRSFSYCFVDFFSNPGSVSSILTFGAGAADTYPPASFTPTVRNLNMDTFYYVRLIGISVGGVRVPGVSERDLQLDPHTGRGGVILDSGTTVTRLARPVYTAFRDAFRAAATDLGQVSTGGPSHFFDTCYSVGGGRVKVPAVSMHFASGVEVRLPPKNYLIPVDSRGTVCFVFAGTGDRSVSIIGNLQQQGIRIVYDIDGQRVGFAPNNC